MNPNSKTSVPRDHTHNPPTRASEPGSTPLYSVEGLGYFLPQDLARRIETMNWLFWLQGAASFPGSDFGHFYHYAPIKIERAIDHFTVEARRLFDVLDEQPARHKSTTGDEYIIADMTIWPRFGNVVLGGVYDVAEFLSAGSYKHVQRQTKEVGERPAVKRGCIVNRTNGPLDGQLHEHYDTSDFETNTEGKRQG